MADKMAQSISEAVSRRRGSIHKLAQDLTQFMLERSRIDVSSVRRVPLRRIAELLGMTLEDVDGEIGDGPQGALWRVSNREREQEDIFGNYMAEAVGDQSLARTRFTWAHEIAHRAALMYLTDTQTVSWSACDWKVFLDDCAARLILPDEMLLRDLDASKTYTHFTLTGLQKLARSCGVSLSCLLTRLNQASCDELISVKSIAMLAKAATSRRKKADFGARIAAVLAPREWFIATDRRLSSVGLNELDRLFWKTRPFESNTAIDKIKLLARRAWTEREFQLRFTYVVFQPKVVESSRFLLATSSDIHRVAEQPIS